MRRYFLVSLLIAVLLVAIPATFALDVGSDGSDGAFNPTSNVTIDLNQAISTSWNTPSPLSGKGVYDGAKWAVVFKYSSVNIPANVTVTFRNHRAQAPVVWLVQGNVTIAGRVLLTGGDAFNQQCSAPPESGPGGKRAGKGPDTWALPEAGAGGGPGGGSMWSNTRPSYGSPGSPQGAPTYGNAQLLPLLGGSGGSGGHPYYKLCGGGAGGAILIASGGVISLQGEINADGGRSFSETEGQGGTGGGIRLVAETVSGSGLLRARGGYTVSGNGRIRVEANTIALTDQGIPLFSGATPTNPATLWPAEDAPTVRAVRLGGKSVPADPTGSLNNNDVMLNAANPLTLEIEATNVPIDWIVDVRVVPVSGMDTTVQATRVSGDQALSQWTASVTLPINTSTIQVRAHKP